jgi:RHS repeat-associated protein
MYLFVTVTSQLTWDTNGSLSLVLSDGTNDYIYGPGTTPVEEVSLSTSTPTYMTYTASDSSWLTTNSAGDETGFWGYDAFGNLAFGTPTSPLGYGGQYTDPSTGFSNMRARWYGPQTGTFTTRDAAFASTDTAYTYAGDDPVNNTDPTGEITCPSWVPGCGVVTDVQNRVSGQVGAIVALVNGEQVPLYKEYSESIHASAATWDVSPILLGTVIELEGGGFETLTQAFGVEGRAAQWATDLSGIDAAPGIGSTMPGNIQQVYETYCNYTPSLSSIRADLALSNPYGIWATAGYLRLLRDDFAKDGYGYLTDREDAISYNVGGESDWPILTKSNWQGIHATPRGEAYDAVSAIVAASPGY